MNGIGRIVAYVPLRRNKLLALLALMWRADRRLFILLATITVALGTLPNAIVLTTGWFTGSVSVAVRDGISSAAGHRALWALTFLGVFFTVNGVLLALARWLVEVANTAFARRFAYELGRGYLAPRYIDKVEDSEVSDQLENLRQFESTGAYMQAIPALRMVASRRIGGVGAAVILFGLSWWAPFVMMVGWLAARWGSSRWVQRGFDVSRAEGAGALRRAEYLREFATSTDCAKEVRIFGLGLWLAQRYAQTWRDAMARVWTARRASSRDLALGILAILVAHLAVLGWLGWQAYQGQAGPGEAVTLGMAILATADLGFLGDQEWRLARAGQLASILREVTNSLYKGFACPRADQRPHVSGKEQSRDIDDTRFARDVARPPGSGLPLDISGLRFTYPAADRPVLDGLDLHVTAGESIAIVGENGAGKSTLLKLLCGLYRPDAGVIRLDGQDLRGLDAAELSLNVSIVFQHFLRYELPLRENIGFGSLKLLKDIDGLSWALHNAGADDLLSLLPNGWESTLAPDYDDGVDLSGGQWQKVALARALLAVRAGAGLLILDEPTASLDVRAEAELFDRFLDVTSGLTTILVSHRLYGVRRADRILVLSGGQVVEDGSHDELMHIGGIYASMFRLQAQRFASDQVQEVGSPDA